jgi:hypothetical protein
MLRYKTKNPLSNAGRRKQPLYQEEHGFESLQGHPISNAKRGAGSSKMFLINSKNLLQC